MQAEAGVMQVKGVEVDPAKVDEILGLHPADSSSLIMVLQDIQREFSFLPMPALQRVSEALSVSMAKIHAVATFYKAFSMVPKGRNTLRVCLGTACHIRGAKQLVDEVERLVHIRPGETSEDLDFSLETVNCVGACAMAPVFIVNETYHGKARASRLPRILKKVAGGQDSAD
jgi:NADH-quinone oxidoreductase subunit E